MGSELMQKKCRKAQNTLIFRGDLKITSHNIMLLFHKFNKDGAQSSNFRNSLPLKCFKQLGDTVFILKK